MTLDDLRANPGFAYLASPYSLYADGYAMAAFDISIVAARLIERGVSLFSPICHSHAIATNAGKACMRLDSTDHVLWLGQDKPLLEAASCLLVAALPGWQQSVGIATEVALAASLRKPRYVIDPETLAITPFADAVRGRYIGLDGDRPCR